MPDIYEIRVSQHLGCQWSDWFNDFTIIHHENGTTTLRGQVADQAALYGLLNKISDMGLILLSVNRVESPSTQEDRPETGVTFSAERSYTPMTPLFEKVSSLHKKLPYISLADLPTPIHKLERLGAEIDVNQLYIKRDDLSGTIYGGNKIRKLEFLLGDALRNNAQEVMTFGFIGSNHALATAIYAHQVGLKSISMLIPQRNATYVRQNLLMSYAIGAELNFYQNEAEMNEGIDEQLQLHQQNTGHEPYIIPAGGSSPLGTIGYVNAALELKKQINQGLIPEPDLIYAAMGTTGTVVGLMIGLKLAGLETQVVPVRVVDTNFCGPDRIAENFTETVAFLRSLDQSFPMLEPSMEDTQAVDGFLGDGYACLTEACVGAVKLMAEQETIKLDGTYTGKTLAALLRDAGEGILTDKVVLFWNTLNSRDFSKTIANIDYQLLPQAFHHYFETEVQQL